MGDGGGCSDDFNGDSVGESMWVDGDDWGESLMTVAICSVVRAVENEN